MGKTCVHDMRIYSHCDHPSDTALGAMLVAGASKAKGRFVCINVPFQENSAADSVRLQCRFQGRAKQVAFERVRANVRVRNRAGIDHAPDDKPRIMNRTSIVGISLKKIDNRLFGRAPHAGDPAF